MTPAANTCGDEVEAEHDEGDRQAVHVHVCVPILFM